MQWNVQEVVDEIQAEEQELFKARKAGLLKDSNSEFIDEEVFYLRVPQGTPKLIKRLDAKTRRLDAVEE